MAWTVYNYQRNPDKVIMRVMEYTSIYQIHLRALTFSIRLHLYLVPDPDLTLSLSPDLVLFPFLALVVSHTLHLDLYLFPDPALMAIPYLHLVLSQNLHCYHRFPPIVHHMSLYYLFLYFCHPTMNGLNGIQQSIIMVLTLPPLKLTSTRSPTPFSNSSNTLSPQTYSTESNLPRHPVLSNLVLLLLNVLSHLLLLLNALIIRSSFKICKVQSYEGSKELAFLMRKNKVTKTPMMILRSMNPQNRKGKAWG